MTLDADARTLHIRCGSDIRERLKIAGLDGDFLEYSDPVCQGPVPDGDDLLICRARFLAANYGGDEGTALARLQDEDRRIAAAYQYERVVMWFEHDSYDQLILARLLARFADGPRPPILELICIDSYPGVMPRFIGLGQLEAADLAGLWPLRVAVTAEQLDMGRAVWHALRQPDPRGLQGLGTPVMARAPRRHLQELPGVTDGLSLTERQVLQILAVAPTPIGRIFGAFQLNVEPLPFLGDPGVLATVEGMALTQPPVLTIEPGNKPFPRVATITDTGRDVLAGATDYLTLSPPERWVGGVRVDGWWRWDDAAGQVVAR